MQFKNILIVIVMVLALISAGCSQEEQKSSASNELKHFSLDSMKGIITKTGIELDKGVSSDGGGSLRVNTEKATTVRLLEVRELDVEDARLMYQARVRTEDFSGQVYIEMWVNIPGKGEFFTRNTHTPLSGTADWVTMQAPFFLKKGQNPDYAKLNLVMEGKGTAWIDDIRLVRGPLN